MDENGSVSSEVLWVEPLELHPAEFAVRAEGRALALTARQLPGWRCIHTHLGFGYGFAPERSQFFHDLDTSR